jgi:hypothetical protein
LIKAAFYNISSSKYNARGFLLLIAQMTSRQFSSVGYTEPEILNAWHTCYSQIRVCMFSMQTFFMVFVPVPVNAEILQFAMQVHQVEALVAYKFNEEA